jgi:hypothetical protein
MLKYGKHGWVAETADILGYRDILETRWSVLRIQARAYDEFQDGDSDYAIIAGITAEQTLL